MIHYPSVLNAIKITFSDPFHLSRSTEFHSMCWIPLLSYSRNIHSECFPRCKYGARCGNMKCRGARVPPRSLLSVRKMQPSPQQWETALAWGETWAKGKEKQVFRGSSLDPPESGSLTFLCLRSDPLVSFKFLTYFWLRWVLAAAWALP